MKLAIISDEFDQDVTSVARYLSGTCVRGVEIRSLWDCPPHLLTLDHLDRARRCIAVHNLECAGFCSPVGKCPLPKNDSQIDEVRNALIHAIEQAVRLGSPHLRIFSFIRKGVPDPRWAARITREILAGVDTKGVRILVETGTRTNTPTVRHALQFLEVVENKMEILWDPGNSVFSGFEPNPFPIDYEIGRRHIRHIHVKDP